MKKYISLCFCITAVFTGCDVRENEQEDIFRLSRSSDDSEPHVYIGVEDEVLAKDNLPATMLPQLPNTCVTSIMQYIDNNVFNGNADEGDYLLYYWQTFHENIVTDGVDLDDIEPFVSHFFNLGKFSTFQSSINDGFVVMTDMWSQISNSAHNILVLGYQPSDELIYMDPEKGRWFCAGEQLMAENYKLVVTGIK